ncbi:MAG: histidine triad nucleotide-binding protein, partial [Anaerovoracaceae bacterium]
MNDCIFCKIAEKEIPANVVYEDEQVVCFHDLEPQAPVHVLLIPKKHIESTEAFVAEDQELAGHMLLTIKKIAEKLNLENGYRVVINCGED